MSAPPSPSTPPRTPSIELLKSILRSTLRIAIADGRVFLGTFVGTDKALNILLVNADEFRLGPGENPGGRYVGQLMVPWRLVKSIEMQADGVSDGEREEDGQGDGEGDGDGLYV
ncbi:hypothetical protein FA95DRAFT_1500376 [Auriscalpium vulgare]|uniref:Uncharacterized protein n=1 Tax=Auriscalpium vulgare TaxID=40419 RepID=A0ACB8RDX3_9AGAM|nr:hypothetical protein FA95DRAFT_1500376 [Auriscalpium vulgare]